MRKRMLLSLFLITAIIGPAAAQDNDRGGIRTETMNRLSGANDYDLLWNAIGVLGLLGLLGLGKQHGDDSYHPAPLE